jgi:hypothetical protein
VNCIVDEIVDEILRKIPRPNYSELPELYEELDRMTKEIGRILMESKLFDKASCTVKFDKASVEDIERLISKNPEVMVPFFVTVCGFSERELARLHGIKNVYSLRERLKRSKLRAFAEAVCDQLKHPISLETLLFKFYKNWEEHQKRHRRARYAEELVIDFLRSRGYEAGKIRVNIGGKEREIDCAIPPDPNNPQVVIQIRRGVLRDLVKRAKEYSTEFDEILQHYKNIKFVVVYFVLPHEQNRIKEIQSKIASEREGKKPYDLVLVISTQEELEHLVKKLEEWGVPKRRSSCTRSASRGSPFSACPAP